MDFFFYKKFLILVIFCQLLSLFICKEYGRVEKMNNSDNEKNELCKKLWTECKDDLTKMCEYKLSSHPGEVEDVIADAFYYLCVAVFENKRIENHKAWLIAVTNNLIKKKYSEINIIKSRYANFYEENIDSYACEDELFLEDVSDMVIDSLSSSVLSQLSESEQLLYKYVYVDKLKMKEIADLLKLTEVNVRQRNFRLSKRIKSLIKKYIEGM